MKTLLLASLAAAALVLGAGPAVRAWEPCSQLCPVPIPCERKIVICYRTETRTELRLVPRKVCRTVSDTKMETIEEKVLVPFYRDEERKKEVMVPTTREEERKCSALIVDVEKETRVKELMAPKTEEETRKRVVCDLQTVPELRKKRVVSIVPITVPICNPCTGAVHTICQHATQVCVTSEIVYHLLPVPREIEYKTPLLTYVPKEEKCVTPVLTFKESKPVKETVCDYTPKTETCKVSVFDVREETRKHTVPVTTYRTIEETVMEEKLCTVEVQVPYEKEVWVPACKK